MESSAVQETTPTQPPLTREELMERGNQLEETVKGFLAKDTPERRRQIEAFIAAQLEEKERFAHIFKTDHGSVYFTLNTGESLRLKNKQGRIDVSPVCCRLFFVGGEQAQQLAALQKDPFFEEKIIGRQIQTTDLDIGATPIEFGIINFPPQHFTEEPSKLILQGDTFGTFASGFHQGHPVSEIIK